MNSESIHSTSCPSERATDSAPTPLTRLHSWRTDAEYVADQDRDSSWSHLSAWGEAAAVKFIQFGALLGGALCHDDVVADFGGNDGFAAHCFHHSHGIKPLVVDCEPKRLEYASSVYKLRTLETFLEHMPTLDDCAVDWSFCSHTLEHTRHPEMAIREIRRVTRRGACFIVPLEKECHGKENAAHAVCISTVSGWRKLIESCGWKVLSARKSKAHPEAAFLLK